MSEAEAGRRPKDEKYIIVAYKINVYIRIYIYIYI